MSVSTHWIWEPEEVDESPSVKAGMSLAQEEQTRAEGIRMIMELGKALNLPTNPTLATASIFFHRFYMAHTFDIPQHVVGLACLFLAGKVEDTPKRCRDLVNNAMTMFPKVWVACISPQEEVMQMERLLLQTLRFDLHLVHPYHFLIEYTKGIQASLSSSSSSNKCCKNILKNAMQHAWNSTSDQLCTTLCLRWEPEVIAIAMLYLAFKLVEVKGLTAGDDASANPNRKEWWTMYVAKLSVEMIEGICHKLADHWDRHGAD